MTIFASKHNFISTKVFVLGIATLAFSLSAFSQDKQFGNIIFPNSGSPEAQADFIAGVFSLHNFEYEQANAAFKRAQEIDSGFAMAYWGEAMTFHQSLWSKQSRKSAVDALMRLGRTNDIRAMRTRSQREKDYMRAAETLFGMTEESKKLPKFERDVLYRDAMRRIHETYPEDLEATAFYGLSILGVGSANREYSAYMNAAAVITEVWDANRIHPGAAHYLIHSYDDPVHAVLGLPMARAYSKIAPEAAHAQHMTSHIFSALGMWDDLVPANETAIGIEFDLLSGEGALSREAAHYLYWLQYGYLQQGRYDKAKALMENAWKRLSDHPTDRERTYFGAMYGRYVFDTGNWDLARKWVVPDGIVISTPHYHFALAVAAIQRGDLETAREHGRHLHATNANSPGVNPEVLLNEAAAAVLEKQFDAIIALAEGKNDTAVSLAAQAVELELALPFKYGPPRIVKPTAEMLGDILLKLNRADEAVIAYQDQLSRTARRTTSLLGLARAAKAADQSVVSFDAYRQLTQIWHASNTNTPGYSEAIERANSSVN